MFIGMHAEMEETRAENGVNKGVREQKIHPRRCAATERGMYFGR